MGRCKQTLLLFMIAALLIIGLIACEGDTVVSGIVTDQPAMQAATAVPIVSLQPEQSSEVAAKLDELSPPVLVAEERPVYALTEDLDGDGIAEKLILSGSIALNQAFTFTINGIDQIGFSSSMQQLQGTFSVVDLDTKDAGKQLAFPQTGPSGMSMTSYFSYDPIRGGGDITQLGTVPGDEASIRYLGNGEIITTSQRGAVLSTWFHEQTYALTKAGNIERVEEDLYQANLEVILKAPLDLYTSRSNLTIKGTLIKGEKAVIEKSDDKKWFLIRGEKGVSGWFEIRDYTFVINAGLSSTDLFEGLGNAG